MSFDKLQDRILNLKNPTVAGLDARWDYVPPHIQAEKIAQYGQTRKAAAEAIYTFNCGLMDALCDIVPAVKPQSAYYENLGWEGMEMLERTIRYAKGKGFYVIADIKRGDIGSTATAYAEGWLGKTVVGDVTLPGFDADCVTVNGYMGSDAVKPFLTVAEAEDKSLFVLVRTSNPSAVDLQDREINGRKVYTVMGDLVEQWGEGSRSAQYGFSRVGAVTGATYPEDLRKLRQQMPHTFFLGAWLRRPGRHGSGRGQRLPCRGQGCRHKFFPRDYVCLEKDRSERSGLPGSRPSGGAGYAGGHLRLYHHR
ncbi:MAG: orotidine-5'-phosphate decarboxylase [Oscillospiraceae bacterium]